MEIKDFGLTLYFTATFLAIIAVAFGLDTLRLFTNPIVIPAISFYYIYDKQENYSHWYGFVLFLCFIGDILVFLDLDVVLYIMIPYFISYIILFVFLIHDCLKISFKIRHFIPVILFFVSFLFLLYNLINSLTFTHPKIVLPGLVYGFFLILYGSLGLYFYLIEKSKCSGFLFCFIGLSIFSDVFYVVFKLITQNFSMVFTEFGAQLLSYYFLVKYFSLRKVNNIKNTSYEC